MKNILTLSVLFLSGIVSARAQMHAPSANSSSSSVAATPYSSSNSGTSVARENTPAPAAFSHQSASASAPAMASNAYSTSSHLSGGEHVYHSMPVGSIANGGYSPAATIAAPRYNHVTKNAFPYYSTATSRNKSLGHVACPAKRRHRNYKCAPPLYFPEYYLFYTCEYIYEDAAEDNTPGRMDNAISNNSFDGYVVYNNDTLSGVITPTKNVIVLEEPLDGIHELAGAYGYNDNLLSAVAVFEGNQELYLSRPIAGGKLMRAIHIGKLNIYDGNLRFLTADNVNKGKLILVYKGEVITSKTFLASDGKQLLIEYVNKAYGLNLHAGNFTWSKLLAYIDTLD